MGRIECELAIATGHSVVVVRSRRVFAHLAERSHRTDKREFYQLLTYTDDVDLHAKLTEWQNFYNYQRPHGAFQGKIPYEALREKLG